MLRSTQRIKAKWKSRHVDAYAHQPRNHHDAPFLALLSSKDAEPLLNDVDPQKKNLVPVLMHTSYPPYLAAHHVQFLNKKITMGPNTGLIRQSSFPLQGHRGGFKEASRERPSPYFEGGKLEKRHDLERIWRVLIGY